MDVQGLASVSTKVFSDHAFLCLSKVRVPVGRYILELPAGMLDDDKGDFVGTAVREVLLQPSSYVLSLSLSLVSANSHSEIRELRICNLFVAHQS